MVPELVVAGMVRAWADDVLPGDGDAADRAVGVAERCLAAGASVSESAEEVRRFLRCWGSHPSYRPGGTAGLQAAS